MPLICRGLESFSQLVYLKKGSGSQVIIDQLSWSSFVAKQRGHILPVCCERHSSPRLSTFCTSRSPPWHKQVLDIWYKNKYLGYPLLETPSDTTSQSRCWRPTWTWWRWTSSMCSTGTSSMTHPFHTSPKSSPTWGGSQAIMIDEPAFPSKIGSFDHKLAVYTQQDIAEIIEYWL